MREILSPLIPDPRLVVELEHFRQIEKRHFQILEDQEKARRLYDEIICNENSLRTSNIIKGATYKGEPVLLPKGTVVHRGGIFQVIGEPYRVKLQSVDYGWAASEPLPDGSVVYFPVSLLKSLLQAP